MFDASRTGNLYSALKIGRLLDDLGYIWYEDPFPSEDVESLIVLARALDVPLDIGEYLLEMNSFADYIKRDALDIVRIIADNIGGITGGIRVGQLADAFGLEFSPHNWGNVMDMAVAFQIELASNTNYWFEMPWPVEYSDRVYIKHRVPGRPGRLHQCAGRAGVGLSDRPRRARQGHDPDRPVSSGLGPAMTGADPMTGQVERRLNY